MPKFIFWYSLSKYYSRDFTSIRWLVGQKNFPKTLYINANTLKIEILFDCVLLRLHICVALRRTTGSMVLWLFLCNFLGGGCTLDAPRLKCVILFSDITSLDDAVMSCVMSQHCSCIGHMTFYYKRSINAWVGGSDL